LLEASTNLFDTTGWLTVADTPTLVGNQKVLTNSMTAVRQFFRLRKPVP
jgi:hypothetical protein